MSPPRPRCSPRATEQHIFAFRTEGRTGGREEGREKSFVWSGRRLFAHFPLPHPSSFGHFLPLSGRYAAISNELRVRKIYKTSEQLASPSPSQLPAASAAAAHNVCGAWHGNQPATLARSLLRNSSSCFIFLFSSFPLLSALQSSTTLW